MFRGFKKQLNVSVLVRAVILTLGIFAFLYYLFTLGINNKAVGQLADIKAIAVSVATSTSVVSKSNTVTVSKRNNAPQEVLVSLPYTALPFHGSSWIYDWGIASTTNDALIFGAASTTAGGDLFLAGSDQWTNYSAQADIDWVGGVSFSMIARATPDLKDFIYCDFGNHTARIAIRTDGNDVTLAEAASPSAGVGNIGNFGIGVYGDDVECMVNGAEVVGAVMPADSPATGDIGLLAWDNVIGTSKIIVRGLGAVALTTDTIITPFPLPVSMPMPVVAMTTSIAPTSTAVAAPAKLELPYTETDFANYANWQGTWGAMTIDSSGFMDIGSATDTTGGSAILNNSDNWMNYEFDTTLDWVKGETFMIVARYADSGDYLGCNFVQDSNNAGAVDIELEEFIDGNETTIQTAEDANYWQEGNKNIDIEFTLKDGQATCLFNGHAVTNEGGGLYGINVATGTIGFSTWDPTIGNSEIIIKKVSVTDD